MRLDVRDDVEVARRAAVRSCITPAGDTHARAGFRTRRDAHFQRVDARNAAFAAAVAAHRAKLSRAAAARAGNLKAHFSADLRNLAGPAAGRAGFLVAGRGARTVTHRANVEARDVQLLRGAVHGLGE